MVGMGISDVGGRYAVHGSSGQFCRAFDFDAIGWFYARRGTDAIDQDRCCLRHIAQSELHVFLRCPPSLKEYRPARQSVDNRSVHRDVGDGKLHGEHINE
jgi:hypothetical protein